MRVCERLRPFAQGLTYIFVCYQFSIGVDAKGGEVYVDFQVTYPFATSVGQLGNLTIEAAIVMFRQSSGDREHVFVYRQSFSHIGTISSGSQVL